MNVNYKHQYRTWQIWGTQGCWTVNKVFWNAQFCSLAETWCFRRRSCLHVQNRNSLSEDGEGTLLPKLKMEKLCSSETCLNSHAVQHGVSKRQYTTSSRWWEIDIFVPPRRTVLPEKLPGPLLLSKVLPIYARPKAHYLVYNNSPKIPNLIHAKAVNDLLSHLFIFYFNSIVRYQLTSSKWSPKKRCIYSSTDTCHIPGPSHPSFFQRSNKFWWEVATRISYDEKHQLE